MEERLTTARAGREQAQNEAKEISKKFHEAEETIKKLKEEISGLNMKVEGSEVLISTWNLHFQLENIFLHVKFPAQL